MFIYHNAVSIVVWAIIFITYYLFLLTEPCGTVVLVRYPCMQETPSSNSLTVIRNPTILVQSQQ